MLAFHLDSRDEVERWHRRLLMANVAVLDPPGPLPSGEYALHAADPEGNVLCLFAS
jgi:predicted enzyme related to lactoylglutathione lyase